MRGSLEENGQPVLPDIDIRVEESRRPEGTQWFGSFDVPPGGRVREGGRYQLLLEDGRTGEIAIENVQPENGRTAAGFVGVGPLK